ncbi:hypothetical protein BH10PSE18_BH10PSE18_32510 [soil metagenome]
MKTSYILAAAALSFAAMTGAQAETYDGVQSSTSALSRTEVGNEAARAAAAPNQNVARGSRGAEAFTVQKDRAAVNAEAARTAASPDQNVASGSRVNSKVVSTMQNPVDQAAASRANGASKL